VVVLAHAHLGTAADRDRRAAAASVGLAASGAAGGVHSLLLWSLKALFRLHWPTRYEAMRRVEAKTGLAHRPVSTHQDQLAPGSSDPLQQMIWEEHKLRQLKGLENLKAGAPESSWRDSTRAPCGFR
jgi:hypothetical protein